MPQPLLNNSSANIYFKSHRPDEPYSLINVDNGIAYCEKYRADALKRTIDIVSNAVLSNNYYSLFSVMDDIFALKREGREELANIESRILRTLGSLKYREHMDYFKDGLIDINSEIHYDATHYRTEKDNLNRLVAVKFPPKLITTGVLNDLVFMPMRDLLYNCRLDILLGRLRHVPKSKIFTANMSKLEALLKSCERVEVDLGYCSSLVDWCELMDECAKRHKKELLDDCVI